ncbi:MAG: hypothetical protein VXW30_01135 [Candidatus Thermoplasmatota archaeon]|nr:hypothetical protein [Candidatus Thermoplasmatota archaeon]
MTYRMKTNSLMLTILMVLSTTLIVPSDEVEAAEVVITDAVRVVDGGPMNERMVSMAADSEGNIHFVWSRNTQHLFYTMLDPRADTDGDGQADPLIDATQISNPGIHRAWHPDIAIDSQDRVHVTWTDKSSQHAIKYTVLDPSLHPQDGTAADESVISVVNDMIVSQRQQDRDWPAIAVDSMDNAHIVWEDSFDPLEKFYFQPQIYYSMIEFDGTAGITAIDDSMITPVIGHKGHPDIAVDADDYVQIVWDDTRGGKVEMVVPIDTSGSMYSEWADVCTVFYGGSFSSGGYFRGIKPMLEDANITVYETIYAILGYGIPSAGQSNTCSTAYQTGGSGSQGPRNTHLGQFPGDDSGGIRKLQNFIFNGGAVTGSSGEDWGPSSTWACLSWKDASGNVPGNPPTSADHKWNPNATKIVIPISDEGPRNGDPAQQADDTASINEAHDACVRAGIVPVPMAGSTWGGGTQIQSHMSDLANCPNGVVNTNPRICPGSTIRNTDAGGEVYNFPASGGGSQQMQLLVEAMVYLATNNSREIFMTVLAPHALLDNPSPGWTRGTSATSTSGNAYTEDIGPEMDSNGYGHLVVVNDTRITLDDAFSFHPSIAVDSQGNTHLTWMDGRGYGFEKNVNYEVFYSRLRLRGAATWDGVEGGLPSYGIKQIVDTRISDFEGPNGIPQGTPYSPSSYMPAILTDARDNVHITWLDNSNATQGEAIMYARLNHTNDQPSWPLNSIAAAVLDPWEPTVVSTWQSDKLGPNSGNSPELGQPPAFANDLGSGAHIAWSDTNKCNEESNQNTYTLCYVHVLTGQVEVGLQEGETFYHVIEPSEQTMYNLTVNNTTPGPPDLVADTFSINLSGIPLNWSATVYFSNNHTTIFPDTPIYLAGGEKVEIYMRVIAPSIYQANEDEVANIIVSAISYKDPAIRSDRLTSTLMDVVHGIQLDTSHTQSDIEQGGPAIFSITITNTGNVYDTFQFYDPNTLEGQQEWLLPYGWGIKFPLTVSLEPGASVTKNLEVNVPTTQEPGTWVVFVKGWSTGEPVKSVEKGTYDVLELWINVSIRSSGNIEFEIFDRTEEVLPGELKSDLADDAGCAQYTIKVKKNFAPGHLIFAVLGGPEERNETMTLNQWRQENWYVELDFKNAPDYTVETRYDPTVPRFWSQTGVPYDVLATVCAPANADAGIGPAVKIKAYLQGSPKVSDEVTLSTMVKHVYDLDASTESLENDMNPGETWAVPIDIMNGGNGPDRYDMRITSISDSNGLAQPWNVEIFRSDMSELQRDENQTVMVHVDTPDQVAAGTYQVTISIFSEEAWEGTRLRDVIQLTINVNEYHDMQITLDPYVESAVKTTAPGRTVRFIMNLTNNGNVADTPTLHNHTKKGDGNWDSEPGMNALAGWATPHAVEFALLDGFETEYPIELACSDINSTDEKPEFDCYYDVFSGTWYFPPMPAYTTVQIVAIVNVGSDAALGNRNIGIKVLSDFGSSADGGDDDETPEWVDSCTIDTDNDGLADNNPGCDTNEQILTLRLRAPNLVFIGGVDISEEQASAAVGEMIPVQVTIQNTGNVHATDINIILCVGDEDEIRSEGCEEEDVVYRRVIGALMPSDNTEDGVTITLLYPVTAGSDNVVVVIDPELNIVEVSDDDNYLSVDEKLQSNNPVLDVAMVVVSKWSVPTIIMAATIGLLGVAGLMMISRRKEALDRVAEQSSLLQGLDEDTRF